METKALKLIAAVKRVTGKTENYMGATHDESGKLTGVCLFPDPVQITIEEIGSGYFFFRRNAKGEILADSWFETPEQAMQQGKFEFEIESCDWQEFE